jgi:hypothetical protein
VVRGRHREIERVDIGFDVRIGVVLEHVDQGGDDEQKNSEIKMLFSEPL